MAKKAEAQIRKRITTGGSDIEQLCLDDIQITHLTPTIKKLIEGCHKLQYLTMNNCKLQSLDHFPHLKTLIVLQLADNKLTGQDLNKICHCQQINFITIDSNNIANIQCINALRSLKQLQILQIHDNPIADPHVDYRQIIFQKLPSLKSVDCIDRYGMRIQDQQISQYITNRQRSLNDLGDLLFDQKGEEDEYVHSAQRFSQTKTNQIDQKESRVKRENSFDQDFPKRRLASDSENDEGEMIRDFKKKMQKTE